MPITRRRAAKMMDESEDASCRAPLLGKRDPSLSQRQPSTRSASAAPQSPKEPTAEGKEGEGMEFSDLSRKSQWIALAVMSGACAAFNGVFAKLTTTSLTHSFATSIATLFGLGHGEKVVEVIVRGIFFALNLLFNAIMWALFTKALARGTSTTQVSIINTSSNFMLTAVLGWMIFSESLPPLWFVGAALLVAGNVIIGRREEEEVKLVGGNRSEEDVEENGLFGVEEDEQDLGKDEDVIQLGDLEDEDTNGGAEEELLDLRR